MRAYIASAHPILLTINSNVNWTVGELDVNQETVNCFI